MTGTEKQIKVAEKIKHNVMSLMESKYWPMIPESHLDKYDAMMIDLESKDADYWINTCGLQASYPADTDCHTACAVSIMRKYN